VVEREPEQEHKADRRDPDRGDEDRLRPLEDPQEIEEEIEVPVGPWDEARRPGIRGRSVERTQDARLDAVRVVVPDDGEADDHAHDDQGHHGVVENRAREEGLALLLDVLLVTREPLAVLLAEIPRHQLVLLDEPRTSPARPPRGGMTGRSRPASSFDQGGETTPRRVTRKMWMPMSAMIAPRKGSRRSAENVPRVVLPLPGPPAV